MNILDEIVANKWREIEQEKALFSTKKLESSEYFERSTASMSSYILDPNKSGIISEFKRKSPSKGIINDRSDVTDVIQGYAVAGVSGISILTDNNYFAGSRDDLIAARPFVDNPILRKDFMLDEYQIIQAKSIGADCILLIASILTPKQIKSLAEFARSFEMEVLLEVHDQDELERSMNEHVNLLGVNNRNLKIFKTDIQISKDLAPLIPSDFVKVSESGISDPTKILELKEFGYQGFLIGENFMKTDDPGLSAKEFIVELKSLA